MQSKRNNYQIHSPPVIITKEYIVLNLNEIKFTREKVAPVLNIYVGVKRGIRSISKLTSQKGN